MSTAWEAVERIRLMLLHPRALFRTSLARLLETEQSVELVAECAEAGEATSRLTDSRPDIVICDFGIWREFVNAARDAGYPGKFLAIAEQVEPTACVSALRRGVAGVVLSSDSPARLMQAIHAVGSGGAWVNQEVIQLLADRYPQHEEMKLEGLGEREQAVLRGVLGGLTNRKIADQIGLSEATVKATLQHLFTRTGVRTRSQLVRIMLAETAVDAI